MKVAGLTEPCRFIVGTVMSDTKGRFVDGRRIRTSAVCSPSAHVADGQVIRTCNSRYLLAGTRH